MRLATLLNSEGQAKVCLFSKEKHYCAQSLHQLALSERELGYKPKLEGFNIPEGFNSNFLLVENARDYFTILNDFLEQCLSDCEERIANVECDAQHFACPIYKPPLFFGIIQNSPQYYRKNKIDFIDTKALSGLTRSPDAICGHKERVEIPAYTTSFRCAAELGVVIGTDCYKVDEDQVDQYIFGYTCVNDMVGNCWKNFAYDRHPKSDPSYFELLVNSYYGRCTKNFGPAGPHIVSKDEVDDHYNLLMYTKINGQMADRAYNNAMLIGIEKSISLLSQFVRIKAGSIIHMGTMGKDGVTFEADKFLSSEDEVQIEIESVGTLTTLFNDKRGNE